MNVMISKQNNQGFSLIELMVALVIGLILMLGLIKVFTNVSFMNVTQNGLARLQENGRFVMMRIQNDVEAIGHQPCASISMDSPTLIDRGFALRPMYAAVEMNNGLPSSGLIDPQYFLQGHECGVDGVCTPGLGIFPGGHSEFLMPAAGTTAGSRAKGTDVMTMRVISGSGMMVDDRVNPSTKSTLHLSGPPGDAPLNLESGDKVLIANCYKALITSAQIGGDNQLSIPLANIDPTSSVDWASMNSMTQVYNFSKDFDTISYYVGLKQDASDNTNLISTLYRVENGDDPTEVIEGVERFDVFYGVKFGNGSIAYLTADEVQSNNTLQCVIPPLVPADFGVDPMENELGCLWRSVFAVRIHVLINTVYNSTTSPSETFVYSVDGFQEQLPQNLPSGMNPKKMYRREFSKTIALNSINL